MTNVRYDLLEQIELKNKKSEEPPTGGEGSEPPMELTNRVEKLEEFAIDAKERLIKIETRLDQTATKSDLHEASASQIKWVVGTAVGLGVAGLTIMTFVLNNAVPKISGPSTAPPIIINVPAQAAPPPAPTPAN